MKARLARVFLPNGRANRPCAHAPTLTLTGGFSRFREPALTRLVAVASALLVRLTCPAGKAAGKPSGNTLPTSFTLLLKLPAGAKPLEVARLPGNGNLQPFLIGKHQVTQAQYEAVMGSNTSEFKSGHDHPVEEVNWNEAKAFCAKLTPMLTGPLKGRAK